MARAVVHEGQIGGLQCAPTAQRSCARICLSIYTYARDICIYMYVCTVHYFRRSVNRINAIAKHGWLTELAGWLAGWLAVYFASLQREPAERTIGRARREGPEALRDFLLAQILLHEGRK